MSRFFQLFRNETPPSPGKIYGDDRSDLFPAVTAHSPRLVFWDRAIPIPHEGSFLLVGAATWSGYDMRLLDALEASTDGPSVIGVFDTQECQTMEAFEQRIPGIGPVFQTPAVGLWQDGELVASATGHEGRELAFTACRLDLNRMTELLNPFPASA